MASSTGKDDEFYSDLAAKDPNVSEQTPCASKEDLRDPVIASSCTGGKSNKIRSLK